MKVDPLTAQRDYLRTIAGRLDAIVVGRMFPDDRHHLRIVKDELQFARERIMERPFPETFDKLIRLENETARLTQDFGLAADSH